MNFSTWDSERQVRLCDMCKQIAYVGLGVNKFMEHSWNITAVVLLKHPSNFMAKTN